MNNDEQLIAEFESELHALRPVHADADLVTRLERRMNATNSPLSLAPALNETKRSKIVDFPESTLFGSNRVPLKPWAAVAACAAVATGTVVWNQNRLASAGMNTASAAFVPTPNKNRESRFIQQSSNNLFQGVHEAGMVFDSERGPMRRLRVEFNNQQQFFDLSNGVRLEVTYPTQEEVLIPEPVH